MDPRSCSAFAFPLLARKRRACAVSTSLCSFAFLWWIDQRTTAAPITQTQAAGTAIFQNDHIERLPWDCGNCSRARCADSSISTSLVACRTAAAPASPAPDYHAPAPAHPRRWLSRSCFCAVFRSRATPSIPLSRSDSESAASDPPESRCSRSCLRAASRSPLWPPAPVRDS